MARSRACSSGSSRARTEAWNASRSCACPEGTGPIACAGSVIPADRASQPYDPGMSDRKIRVTVTIDPHLAAYAERLVEAGKAPSVSAVVNDALEAERQRDQKARRLWREAAERADPDQVAHMLAHVEAQAARLPASHRYR